MRTGRRKLGAALGFGFFLLSKQCSTDIVRVDSSWWHNDSLRRPVAQHVDKYSLPRSHFFRSKWVDPLIPSLAGTRLPMIADMHRLNGSLLNADCFPSG